ncbi:MAG: single-stranded-DNA-specific exonuclease RecJ [Ignavibacteria bacterium]|jgi:single-stranded-DNA-specific exonuclease|nr:single-stranded-DNA-specific exonuclease RecJ [Ignavibacteria bacterium]MCU7503506.1 single-stranded-DNA-specific exonuclease RecJ [Ignavibacteria bacterium]MCU7517252.1 single-stranded-DNA-specific exonuclease RecJ [Ignavibacteria bacterium]
MLKKRWKLREKSDENTVKSLADSLNVTPILAGLLVQRKITNFHLAKAFFRPSIEDLHDPFLMKGMEEASFRLIKAITSNELITVHGDYDVDGTCAAALMYLFLKELGARVEIYIPNRLTEGYGISKSGIETIKAKGTSLLIAVDCGITAVEETALAKSLGMDVIICDHHQPGNSIPEAYAVLDPIRPGCNYPFKFLSGAGVAFKLAQAVSERIGKRKLPLKYLDLVAIAGAADIVSLEGENRILVRKGMEQVNTTPRPGIAALIRSAGMEPGNLSAGHVVFTIAPRINAVGRLGDAIRAVDLFITTDEKEAVRLAEVLEGENYQRRKIDELTFSHAIDLVENSVNLDDEIAIVLHEENWHPGVIGIVASRLVERYYRPTVMLTTVDGVAKGSARSIVGFNIYEALKKCEETLLQFGGHEAAAGLALELDKLQEFKEKFNQIVKSIVKTEDVLPEILIDTKINLSELTPKFLRILDEFAPFGPGNMRPTFLAENLQLVYNPRIVGNNHIVLTFRQEGCDRVFDSIGFNLGSYAPLIDKDKNLLDIVFTIEKTMRDGRTFPQLRIKDIRIRQANEEKSEDISINKIEVNK